MLGRGKDFFWKACGIVEVIFFKEYKDLVKSQFYCLILMSANKNTSPCLSPHPQNENKDIVLLDSKIVAHIN